MVPGLAAVEGCIEVLRSQAMAEVDSLGTEEALEVVEQADPASQEVEAVQGWDRVVDRHQVPMSLHRPALSAQA